MASLAVAVPLAVAEFPPLSRFLALTQTHIQYRTFTHSTLVPLRVRRIPIYGSEPIFPPMTEVTYSVAALVPEEDFRSMLGIMLFLRLHFIFCLAGIFSLQTLFAVR